MKWPTVPKNLITAQPAKPEGPKETFARKVAAFRKTHGIAERFIVACVCAQTDRPFQVRYERIDPMANFCIVAVEKVTHQGGVAGASTVKTLPIGKVDFSGWHCPWCQDRRASIQCGRCEMTVCSGRVTPRYNGEHFVCRDSCGCEGMLTQSTEIHGAEEASPKRSEKRSSFIDGAPKLCSLSSSLPRLNSPSRK